MSELLKRQIETAAALRATPLFGVEQEDGKLFNMRAPMHVLIISPSGTGKSTNILSEVRRAIGEKEILIKDTLTTPSLLGTIDTRNIFNAGIMGEIGGKILALDEFNNLTPDARGGLLGVLQNMTYSRSLGYSMRGVFDSKKVNNDFTNIQVHGGHIKGAVTFGCIGCAMYWPKGGSGFIEEHPQKMLALKSRFSLNTPTSSVRDSLDMLRGRHSLNLDAELLKAKPHEFFIPKAAYSSFMDFYDSKVLDEFKDEAKDFNKDEKTTIIPRVQNDLLRFAAVDELRAVYDGKHIRKIVISDSEILIKTCEDLFSVLIEQFQVERPFGSFDDFKDIYPLNRKQSKEWFSVKLNKSIRQIERYLKEFKEKEKLGGLKGGVNG